MDACPVSSPVDSIVDRSCLCCSIALCRSVENIVVCWPIALIMMLEVSEVMAGRGRRVFVT